MEKGPFLADVGSLLWSKTEQGDKRVTPCSTPLYRVGAFSDLQKGFDMSCGSPVGVWKQPISQIFSANV